MDARSMTDRRPMDFCLLFEESQEHDDTRKIDISNDLVYGTSAFSDACREIMIPDPARCFLSKDFDMIEEKACISVRLVDVNSSRVRSLEFEPARVADATLFFDFNCKSESICINFDFDEDGRCHDGDISFYNHRKRDVLTLERVRNRMRKLLWQ